MNGDDVREYFMPERKLENLMMIMHYSLDFFVQVCLPAIRDLFREISQKRKFVSCTKRKQ